MASSAQTIISSLVQGRRWTDINAPWAHYQVHLPLGSPLVVTYSFPDTAPTEWTAYGNTMGNGFVSLTAEQRDRVRAAMRAWDSACGLVLVEVAGDTGDIRLAQTSITNGDQGFGIYPNTALGGDVCFGVGTAWATDNTVIHEIGHALGLQHPFTGPVTLPVGEDRTANTVMSYSRIDAAGNWPYNPLTPQAYDVVAVQYLYGPDVPVSALYPAGYSSWLYEASNPDLAAAFGANTAAADLHYLTSGVREGRSTSSFDALRYLASNPDLIAAFGASVTAGAQHYVQYGRSEGRSTSSFDPLRYIASNADLITAFGANTAAATQHYDAYGYREGRSASAFNATQYLANYSDLRAVFGTDTAAATQHYITHGRAEGRSALA